MRLYNKIILGIIALVILVTTILMVFMFILNKMSPTSKGILVGVYIGLLCLTSWLFGTGYLTFGEENAVVDIIDKIKQKLHAEKFMR